MAEGVDESRRVSTGGERVGGDALGDDGRAEGAGQSNNGNGAPPVQANALTVPTDPSADWLVGFFNVNVPVARLRDTSKIPCVMLGDKPRPMWRTGSKANFEKKIDDERVCIQARTVDETESYLTVYVNAAEPVNEAAKRFGWSESTMVSKFGGLLKDALLRFWQAAIRELYPNGQVPDNPWTYIKIFCLWGEKWKGKRGSTMPSCSTS